MARRRDLPPCTNARPRQPGQEPERPEVRELDAYARRTPEASPHPLTPVQAREEAHQVHAIAQLTLDGFLTYAEAQDLFKTFRASYGKRALGRVSAPLAR